MDRTVGCLLGRKRRLVPRNDHGRRLCAALRIEAAQFALFALHARFSPVRVHS
jgi:hypothetical protein